MKKLSVLITVCLFFLCACVDNGDYLAYQKGALECELAFSVEGSEYEAKLTLSPQTEGAERDAELYFTSPKTLSGVTVRRKSGAYFVGVDGMEIPLPPSALAGFFEVADAFSISGTLERIEAKDGVNVLLVVAKTGRYTVHLDAKEKLPRRIESDTGGRTVDITIKSINTEQR